MSTSDFEAIAMTSLSLDHAPSIDNETSVSELALSPESVASSQVAQPLTPPVPPAAIVDKPEAALIPFKAKPMPKPTKSTNLGPRLTKAAALRMGVALTSSKSEGRGGEETNVTPSTKEAKNTPGYKRTGLTLAVKSLASPSVAPRPTRASMIRCGQVPSSSPSGKAARVPSEPKIESMPGCKRTGLVLNVKSLASPSVAPRPTRASILRCGQPVAASSNQTVNGGSGQVDTKEKSQAVAARRKSLALPLRLAAPSIAPRQTKSSVLRTGGAANLPGADNRKAYNDMTADEKAERTRKMFVGVPGHRQTGSISTPPKSLLQPDVTPRLNRAAMLRTAPADAKADSNSPLARRSSLAVRNVTCSDTPSTASRSSAGCSTRSRSQSVPFVAPRPTKASLLRLDTGKA